MAEAATSSVSCVISTSFAVRRCGVLIVPGATFDARIRVTSTSDNPHLDSGAGSAPGLNGTVPATPTLAGAQQPPGPRPRSLLHVGSHVAVADGVVAPHTTPCPSVGLSREQMVRQVASRRPEGVRAGAARADTVRLRRAMGCLGALSASGGQRAVDSPAVSDVLGRPRRPRCVVAHQVAWGCTDLVGSWKFTEASRGVQGAVRPLLCFFGT